MKKTIKDAMKVLAVGCMSAFYGVGAIICGTAAGILFSQIPADSGYLAVAEFAAAVLAAFAALAILYMCGAWIVRKGRYSK